MCKCRELCSQQEQGSPGSDAVWGLWEGDGAALCHGAEPESAALLQKAAAFALLIAAPSSC